MVYVVLVHNNSGFATFDETLQQFFLGIADFYAHNLSTGYDAVFYPDIGKLQCIAINLHVAFMKFDVFCLRYVFACFLCYSSCAAESQQLGVSDAYVEYFGYVYKEFG